MLLRYLDVMVVLATAPFVVAAGMPTVGYLVGAAAWVLTRLAAPRCTRGPARSGDPRARAGLQVGVMLGRVWIVALAILLARYAGGKDDGIMAAVLVLAAFTVYFALSVVYRDAMASAASPSIGAAVMSTKRKLLVLLGVCFVGIIVLGAIYGLHGTRNESLRAAERVQARNLGQPRHPVDQPGGPLS